MIGRTFLRNRGSMLALLVGVVSPLAGRAVRADLPLPHTATANSSNALLRLTNTNGGPSAFGFWGTGTYGFVGNSTVIGGAGVRGSFFDAATGAPRASGNLGRSTGGGAYYGVWGKHFSGPANTFGAAVYGVSESTKGHAAFFEITNSDNTVSTVLVHGGGRGSAVRARALGLAGAAGSFEALNPGSMAPCLEAHQLGQGDCILAEINGQGNGVLSRHLGSSGNAGAFLIENPNNASFALVAATAGTGGACFCAGQSLVDGDLDVTGGLTPAATTIKIDHPLEPGNRYLQLPAITGPDLKNVLDGVVVLDGNGEAWVELPEWFEAANGEFRYQLTAIGAPAPGLYVAHEIENNAFQIAGGSAGLKVSWQVTGIRQDPYALLKPVAVEVDKPPHEVGRYRHPDAYGLPEQYRLEYEEHAAEYEADSPDDDETVAEATESDILTED